MGDIISTALGFVLIIFLAYFLKRIGVFKLEDKQFLANVLININLPCVIISGLKDFTYDNSLVLAIFLGFAVSLMAIVVGFVVSRKSDNNTKVLHMMSCAGYNIGIFTIPFVSSFLTSTAVVCTLMFDMGNAVMVFGTTAAITSVIVHKDKSNPIPSILKKLFTTVPFVVYFLMLIIISLNITLPDSFYTITDICSSATSFLAMIMIGIMIEFKIKLSELKEVISAIITRYAFSSIISVGIFMLPFFETEAKKALMIALFSPLSTASVVFAQKLGCKPSSVGVFSSLSIIISMIAIISIIIFV